MQRRTSWTWRFFQSATRPDCPLPVKRDSSVQVNGVLLLPCSPLQTSGKTVLCGARNTVRTLICIKTPPLASSASRAPIEVACVLDRFSAEAAEF